MEDISNWQGKFEVCVYAKKLLDKIEYLNTKVKNPIDPLEVKKGIYYHSTLQFLKGVRVSRK